MYLAPLNYDRYFKKVFSDDKICQRFLEDFLNVTITSLEKLPEKQRVTDDARLVEFDYRCQIDNAYVIIDMQQWYIENEQEMWEEVNRLEKGYYKDGVKDGQKEGFREGQQVGREEGEKNKALETARKMLTKGYTHAEIANLTGLSVKE